MTPGLADERGAAAVLVLCSLTLLLGVAAVVVDGGGIRSARAELQSGADAAALAIAKECAYSLPGCARPATAAAPYVGTGEVVRAAVQPAARTVEVAAGAELTHVLASVLGRPRTSTTATAVARWQPRVRREFVPIPIAECEWLAATNGGRRFGRDVVIDYGGGCAGGVRRDPVAYDAELREQFPTDTQCNPPSPCGATRMRTLVGQEVVVSIWAPPAGGATWRFLGFAGFELESWSRNPGQGAPNSGGRCSGHSCISGAFTRTSRVDGRPGGFLLGGEVELVR